MKCKRCLQVGLQLTETNTRLYRLKEKLQKKEKKVQALQDKLNYASSQLVPLRIEDSSFVNQNYIPQRILKKTVNVLFRLVSEKKKIFHKSVCIFKP